MTEETSTMQYTECFVAFIDLLGFKCLVDASKDDPKLIATLVTALNRIALHTPQSTFIKAQHAQDGNITGYKTYVMQVRPFSDSICIFMPVLGGKLPWLLRSIRYIHDRMLELGAFIRGGITIGGMYWDEAWSSKLPNLHEQLIDKQFKQFSQSPPSQPVKPSEPGVLYQADAGGFPITLGPGLIEAYQLESTKADYPRVIASDRLVQYLLENGSFPAFPLTSQSLPDSATPISKFFRKDTDDIRFLDLLHENLDRQDTERITCQMNQNGTTTWRWEHRTTSWSEVVELVKNLADKQLTKDLSESVRKKYEWVKAYAAQSADSQLKAEGE